MSRNSVLTVVGIVALAGSVAMGQATKEKKPLTTQPAGQPAFELPPGMTEADMQACMEAATPGEMHAHLAQGVGVWEGKTTMWMTPEAEPMESTCTTTISPILDGRFYKCKTTGDMGGMPFTGLGMYGFDNVAQEFQGTWIDNCGTGMAIGTGELSSDGETMTWTYEYNCPITKKPTTLRQVERHTGKDSMTLEMYGIFPKTGKEYKMMEIAYTRTSTDVPTETTASASPTSAGH
ncbi:MAG TPA: DUF1579 domain-containing protein [Phycisphaerales bacterium]|nr:DUF1579 domain-containing protein [Phycisphaerales bacterium]